MQTESNLNRANVNGQSTSPDLSRTARNALSGASREFHDVLSDIEHLIKSTTSLTGDELARAKEKLMSRVTDARKSIETSGNGVAEQALETVDRANEYVREQPWQAMGIGAGVGLLLGLLLARRG